LLRKEDIDLNYFSSFTLTSWAVNMRSVQTLCFTHWVSPACLTSQALPPVTFLTVCPSRFHLPASLRSTPITAFPRYYEGSDSWSALSSAQVSLLYVLGLPDHSISTHPVCSQRRFITLPLSSPSFLVSQVQASPFSSRLARHTWPYRVRHPTDWSFTSRCFPPHLAVTQLRSVTGRRAHTRRGLSPL
jgi:hypothetical protein